MKLRYTIATVVGASRRFDSAGLAFGQDATQTQGPAAPLDPFALPKVEMTVGGGDGDWVGILSVS